MLWGQEMFKVKSLLREWAHKRHSGARSHSTNKDQNTVQQGYCPCKNKQSPKVLMTWRRLFYDLALQWAESVPPAQACLP